MINTKYSLTFISEGAGGGGDFLSRKREGFLERGVNRGFTVRKTHLSVDFIIFEAFLEKKKKKKNMFISCNRAEKQTNVLKKCYVEAMLVKSLKTIMDE